MTLGPLANPIKTGPQQPEPASRQSPTDQTRHGVYHPTQPTTATPIRTIENTRRPSDSFDPQNDARLDQRDPRNIALYTREARSENDPGGLGRASNADRPEAGPRKPSGEPLTDEEQQQVQKLRERDAEVRAHENAHLAAAGALARGGPNYTTKTGPDGKEYAVGGSVSIDTSPADTPEKTITKAQQIRRAALAPAEPSGQDRAVAASATKMEAQARQELSEQRAEETNSATENTVGPPGSSTGETPPGTNNQTDSAHQRAEAVRSYANHTGSGSGVKTMGQTAPSIDVFG